MANYPVLAPMKAKPDENEFLFGKNTDGKLEEFRFHVFMYGSRYRHVNGKTDPVVWKKNNRFLVHNGPDGGEFFVYLRSEKFDDDAATRHLQDMGYVTFQALGSIDSAQGIIQFELPTDTNLCVRLLHRVNSDDSRLIEYYKGFTIFAPDGTSLGKMEAYLTPE